MILFRVYTCIVYHMCGTWSWRTYEMHSVPFQNRVWQEGPYKIVKVIFGNSYMVETLLGKHLPKALNKLVEVLS
jgi:hypothetical protein